ncbi:MAG: CPBP family intramembrane metalloprotease [Oscillospiraceae bacterium]|nr:CPBP family intramembrane metalloprotease [Oscillospiraceae bacterium]
MSKTGKILKYIIVTLLIFIFQQAASRAGGAVADLFDYSTADPDGTFLWISVHHIVQMAAGLLMILCLSRTDIDFCLSSRYSKTGIKYIVIFSAFVEICSVLGYMIMYKYDNVVPDNNLDPGNIIGTLSFQLVLSGPSEEILFRALPVAVLCSIIRKEYSNKYCVIPVVTAALLFSAAHINWSIDPFELQFSTLQLIYAFVFGIAYGLAYLKTKSILYPMIMHSVSNVLMVGTGYIFYAVRGGILYD